MRLRLPWELSTIYTDHLRQLAADGPADGAGAEEEADEEDLEAQEASLQRLRVSARPKSTQLLSHHLETSGQGGADASLPIFPSLSLSLTHMDGCWRRRRYRKRTRRRGA